MLTAFSQREVVEEARDAGALAFLVKPFQKSDLIPAIEVAMGRFRELRTLTGEIDALAEQLEALRQRAGELDERSAAIEQREGSITAAGAEAEVLDNDVAAEVEAEVRQHFGDLVFTTTVPRSVRLAEAPSHGLPAIAYDRRSAGAEAYWKVAMELVERS